MKTFVVFALAVMHFSFSFAQVHTRLVNNVAAYINANEATALFNLFDSTFKEQFPLVEVERAIPSIQGGFGRISQVDSVTKKDQFLVYKLTGEKNSIYLIISTGKDKDKLASLLFSQDNPYNTIITNRDYLKTDNPLITPLEKFIDSTVKNILSRSNTPAVSIGIIHNGKEYRYNYGETIIGNKTLPNGNTVFEIGSVTKTFTGTILSRLIREKKITLEDEVNTFLPDSIKSLEFGGKKLLVKHLVNHTGTFASLIERPYGAPDSEDKNNQMKYYDKQHIFAYLNDRGLIDTPGVRFRYSNLGYAILGIICEEITGKTMSTLYNEWVFTPLGMDSSFMNDEKSMGNILPYKADGTVEAPFTLKAFGPSGSMKSTMNDMLKFMHAQLNPGTKHVYKDILKTHSLLFMGQEPSMALSWFTHQNDTVIHYNHSGGTAGFASRFIFNTQHKTGVIVLSNCVNYDANAIADVIYYSLQ